MSWLPPDRLTPLIQKLESGKILTTADVVNLSALQALDIAKMGEDFVRDVNRREAEQTEAFRQLTELP